MVRTLCGKEGFIGGRYVLHIKTSTGNWKFFQENLDGCWRSQPLKWVPGQSYSTDEYIVLVLPDGFDE